MPDAFDMLGDPVTTDKGTIYDYDASLGEAFGAGFDRQMDTNPLALAARQARFFTEDMGSLAGIGERVDQKTAEEEVRRRGLDLKIPKGGITRYELDTLQYLKQREIAQNTVGARARGITGAAAGFAGGLAGSFTDPINIASNFIPFVSEARYASWLAKAGTSTLARAGVRAGAGAIEGAAGAAVLEPLVYAGATSQQLDYTSTDSFLNVVFGGVMGGGLHPVGGAIYDARVSRALRGLDPGILAMRDAVANAPDHVKRDIFQSAVAQVERGEPVDVGPQINAWHTSPHVFDSFDISKVGSGEGQQAFGHGIYLAESAAISGKGGYYETQFNETHGTSNIYQVQVTARPEDFLDWKKPIGEQSPQVQEAIKRIPQVAKLSANDAGMNVYSVLLNSKKADGSTFTKADISEALKAEGIKGIRHAAEEDGGKSRNLVVFDDKDVRIVSRNGEPVDVVGLASREAAKTLTMRRSPTGDGFAVVNGLGDVVAEIDGKQYETGYHGTATMFDRFEARHNDLPILAPGDASTNGAPITVNQPAVYFTSSKEEALGFANTAEGDSPRVIERQIPIGDLLTVDLKGDHFLMHQGPAFLEAQKQGKKGVRFLNTVDTATNSKRPATIYAVFDPELVNTKSKLAGQRTPRDLGGLIEQAKADRSEAAFNRQFGDEADEAASRAADEAVTKASEDLQTVAEDMKFLDDQIKGLKSRELWTKADDDAIAQGDEAAKAYEKEASIYRAAAVCMMEG